MINVLFVCMGNICRSPTAEAVFTHLVEQANLLEHIHIDSAGTHGYHVGQAPDRRTIKAGENRGLKLQHLRARQVHLNDFNLFDYIIAMDENNYEHLIALAKEQHHEKITLLLSHVDKLDDTTVPDPYYGGEQGFEQVIDLVFQGSEALLNKIRAKHKL